MESLAKQHRGPASSTKAVTGEPQFLQYGMSSLTKRDLICVCCRKRVSQFGSSPSDRWITSKSQQGKVALYKVVCGPLDTESMMLQSSWHLPPSSKGQPQAAGTLNVRCGRTGERGGLVFCPAGRQPLLRNSVLLVPLAAGNLEPGSGRKNDTKKGQKRVFICSPFRWLLPVDPMGKRQWGDFSFPSRVGSQGAGHQAVGSERPSVLLALWWRRSPIRRQRSPTGH